MLINYLNIFILFFFSIILSSLIYFLSFFFIKKSHINEKISAYECGFNPYEDARNQFNIHFYLIAILFIIFDIEVLFIFPWAISLKILTNVGFWIMIDFLIELIIGYIYIWKKGVFNF